MRRDRSIQVKVAKQKVAKVHSTVQRDALSYLLGMIEEQQEEIDRLNKLLEPMKGE